MCFFLLLKNSTELHSLLVMNRNNAIFDSIGIVFIKAYPNMTHILALFPQLVQKKVIFEKSISQ